MVGGIIFNQKRFKVREYVNVGLITLGIFLFNFFDKKAKSGGTTSMAGLFLLMLSLALDAYTGPNQDRLRRDPKLNPTIHQMMLWMNVFAVLMLTPLLLFYGGLDALNFITKYPRIIPDILIFGALSAFGQMFILMCMFRFNSLVITMITTTRKFFTILASVLWYGHHLGGAQWSGVSLVFLALGLDIYYKYFLPSDDKHGDKHGDKDKEKGKDKAPAASTAPAASSASKEAAANGSKSSAAASGGKASTSGKVGKKSAARDEEEEEYAPPKSAGRSGKKAK